MVHLLIFGCKKGHIAFSADRRTPGLEGGSGNLSRLRHGPSAAFRNEIASMGFNREPNRIKAFS
jgi:hypothetical protein